MGSLRKEGGLLMTYMEKYQEWLKEDNFDAEFLEELKSIPEAELEDRFYKELEFGTAGMRGINGAGSNRMNKYIVRRATQGYAMFLSSNSDNPSCAIAYDNRLFSKYFAMEAASVLAANGVKTYIFEELRPTPELSFTIRHLDCTGGIVCTASHNPPEYSGYKVYGDDGCQLNTTTAAEVSRLIAGQDGFSEIKIMDFETAVKEGKVEWIGAKVDRAFVDAVKSESIHPEAFAVEYKSVYTPLHGAGGKMMKMLFDDVGLKDVHYLESQMKVDPYFSTCKSPNPEDEAAFKLSIEKGKEIGAKLLVASDPDADRLGCLLMGDDGEYVKISGNQIGALMAYYVFGHKKNMPKEPCIVKSIVTSDLTNYIAEDFGVLYMDKLTGFKNICGVVREFDKNGRPDFVMGFEESYGYLVGTHCRDKDSLVSSMLLIEMAKYYHSQGKTLFDVLGEIYEKYGYFQDSMIALKKVGKSGVEEINAIMKKFRSSYKDSLKGDDLIEIYDYLKGEKLFVDTGKTEVIDEEESNVLKYKFACGSWVALRPSGTEPKIKFYFSIRAKGKEEATDKMKKMQEKVMAFAGE